MKRIFRIYLFQFFLFFLWNNSIAQNSLLDKKISISVVNERLGDVLLKISNMVNLDFSYNPEIISTDKPITYHAVNKSLLTILTELTNRNQYEFKLIGKKLLISKKENTNNNSSATNTNFQTKQNKKPLSVVSPAQKKQDDETKLKPANNEKVSLPEIKKETNDTIMDSIKKYKSLKDLLVPIKKEIIQNHDTILTDSLNNLTERPIPEKKIEQSETKILPAKISNLTTTNRKHISVPLSIGLTAAPVYPLVSFKSTSNTTSLERIKNAEIPALSFTVNGVLKLNVKRFHVQTGISYTKINLHANYAFNHIDSIYYYIVNQTPFWKINILDSFYVVKNKIDTTWRYITDSIQLFKTDSNKMLRKDISEIKNKSKNSFSYIEIPLIFGYKFNYNKFSYSIRTGLIAGFLKETKGKTLDPVKSETFVDINGLPLVKTIFSYYFAFAINYRINNKINLVAEPFFRRFMHSTYSNQYAISQKFSATGMHVGIIYLFN